MLCLGKCAVYTLHPNIFLIQEERVIIKWVARHFAVSLTKVKKFHLLFSRRPPPPVIIIIIIIHEKGRKGGKKIDDFLSDFVAFGKKSLYEWENLDRGWFSFFPFSSIFSRFSIHYQILQQFCVFLVVLGRCC